MKTISQDLLDEVFVRLTAEFQREQVWLMALGAARAWLIKANNHLKKGIRAKSEEFVKRAGRFTPRRESNGIN